MRLEKTEKALRTFCKIERQNLESRLKLLTEMEEGAVHILNADSDVTSYVANEKNVEETHLRSKAIEVYDWDYARRWVHLCVYVYMYLNIYNINAHVSSFIPPPSPSPLFSH